MMLHLTTLLYLLTLPIGNALVSTHTPLGRNETRWKPNLATTNLHVRGADKERKLQGMCGGGLVGNSICADSTCCSS